MEALAESFEAPESAPPYTTREAPPGAKTRERNPDALRAAWRRAQEERAAQLERIGYRHWAEQLRECRRLYILTICTACGYHQYRLMTCNRRDCEYCSRDRAKLWASRLRVLPFAHTQAKHITLTIRRADSLKAGLAHLRESIRRWVRHEKIATRLTAYAYTIEAKAKPDGWHVHAHMMADAAYIPRQIVWATWARACRQRTASARISQVPTAAAAHYLASYVAKGDARDTMTDAQRREHTEAMHHTRTVALGGKWYRHDFQEHDARAGQAHSQCPDCHQESTIVPVQALPRYYGQEWREWLFHHTGGIPHTCQSPPPHVPTSTAGHIVAGIALLERQAPGSPTP